MEFNKIKIRITKYQSKISLFDEVLLIEIKTH